MRLTLGIDIGQLVDPTAIVLTEQVWKPIQRKVGAGDAAPTMIDHHYVRHMERLDLGTTYPQISEALIEIWAATKRRLVELNVGSGQGKPIVPQLVTYIDATGVGKPVVDVLLDAGVPIIPTYFNHGDKRVMLKDERKGLYINLGKAYLVSTMQALLQTNRIHFPKQSQEAKQMARELLDYEIKVDTNANDKYGAFKVGSHDDLVTAAGLTVQELTRPSMAAMAIGGYTAPRVPTWAQAPQPVRRDFSGQAVRVFTGQNGWGGDGSNGADKYGGVEEVIRLTRRREGFTP